MERMAYMKPEEAEAIERKRARDAYRSGCIGEISWSVVQGPDGRERLTVYKGGKELDI